MPETGYKDNYFFNLGGTDMKTRFTLLIAAIAVISSCGTTSQYASSQQYEDGIYYRASANDAAARKTSDEELEL